MNTRDGKNKLNHLIRKTKEYQTKINKKLQQRNVSILDLNVLRYHDLMKRAFEKIIFLDYEFSKQEDIETKIWKQCIYNIIDHYRKKIKQLMKRVKRPDVDLTQDQSAFLASKELDNLSNEFRRFLESSIGFYSILLRKFSQVHNISLDKPIHSSIEHGSIEYFKYLTCYQILIYIGDLSRYHKDIPDSDEWKVSVNYYKKAQLLLPHIGKSYNQNSIISIYNNNDIQALYYSYRSIHVAQPFQSANISLFFEKILKKGNLQEDKFTAQQFYRSFILMHAYLFNNDLKQYNNSTSNFTQYFFSFLNELRSINNNSYEDLSTTLFYCFVINIAALNQIQDRKANLDEIYRKHFSLSMDMYKYVIKEFLLRYQRHKNSAVKLFIPSIYVFTLWISSFDRDQKEIENMLGKSRMNDLKHFHRNLTNILSDMKDSDYMSNIVLQEELELYGFIPLENQLKSQIMSNKNIYLTKGDNINEKLMKVKSSLKYTSLFADKIPTRRHIIPVQILNPLNSVLKDLQDFDSDSEDENEKVENRYEKSTEANDKGQIEYLVNQQYLSDISINMPPHLLNESEDFNIDPLNPTSIWSGMNISKSPHKK